MQNSPRRCHAYRVAVLLMLAGLPSVAAAMGIGCRPADCPHDSATSPAIGAFVTAGLSGGGLVFLTPAHLVSSATGPAGGASSATFATGWEFLALRLLEHGDYVEVAAGEPLRLYTLARGSGFPSGAALAPLDWRSIGAGAFEGGAEGGDFFAFLFPGAAFSAVAGDMRMSVESRKRAFRTALDEDALLQRKFTLVGTAAEPAAAVPVPPAVWLFGSALGLVGWLRRRVARSA